MWHVWSAVLSSPLSRPSQVRRRRRWTCLREYPRKLPGLIHPPGLPPGARLREYPRTRPGLVHPPGLPPDGQAGFAPGSGARPPRAQRNTQARSGPFRSRGLAEGRAAGVAPCLGSAAGLAAGLAVEIGPRVATKRSLDRLRRRAPPQGGGRPPHLQPSSRAAGTPPAPPPASRTMKSRQQINGVHVLAVTAERQNRSRPEQCR
eukprot:9503955-Pyramimonas_sp.AAC.2